MLLLSQCRAFTNILVYRLGKDDEVRFGGVQDAYFIRVDDWLEFAALELVHDYRLKDGLFFR